MFTRHHLPALTVGVSSPPPHPQRQQQLNLPFIVDDGGRSITPVTRETLAKLGVSFDARQADEPASVLRVSDLQLLAMTQVSPYTTTQNHRMARVLERLNDEYSPLSNLSAATEGSSGGNAVNSHPASHTQLKQQDGYKAAENSLRVVRGITDLQGLIDIARRNVEHTSVNGTRSSSTITESKPSQHSSDRDRNKRGKEKEQPKASLGNSTLRRKTEIMDMSSFPNNNSAEKRIKAGRKPIRIIREELNEKLAALRGNQNHWEVFSARIMALKNAENIDKSNNFIQQNITTAPESDERNERLAILRFENEEHRKAVYDNKKRIFHDTIERKLKVVESSSKQNKLKGSNAKLEAQQRRWIYIIAIASRLYFLRRLLQERHGGYIEHKRQTRAALIIQTFWREYKQRQYEKRKKAAMRILSRFFAIHMIKRRKTKKEFAADMLRDFFKEIDNVSRLSKIIKKYRYSVVKVQRLARTYSQIKRCQLNLLTRQWEKVESAWLAQYKKPNIEQEGAKTSKQAAKGVKKTTATKKKKENASKDSKSARSDDILPTIPLAVKLKTLNNLLCTKRKQYNERYWKYRDALQEYERTIQLRSIPDNVEESDGQVLTRPLKPFFKVLMAESEMMTLVSQTFEQNLNSTH